MLSIRGRHWPDHLTRLLLLCSLGAEVCCVLRLSGPLKQQYAQVRAPPPRPPAGLPWRPTDPLSPAGSVVPSTGARSGPGAAPGPRALQGAAPGRHDPLGGESAAPGPWVLLSPGNQRGGATAVGGCGLTSGGPCIPRRGLSDVIFNPT